MPPFIWLRFYLRFAVLSLCVLLFASAAHSQEVTSYDKTLSGFDYPFKVSTIELNARGDTLSMAYMYLPPKQGMAVVTLFHGKNFNGAYWQQTADLLHNMGFGVLIPDQIGFGKSSKPINYHYSFARLAHNTQKLMDKLAIENSIIVGHSMGGMLATRFSLMYPERSEKLVLINPIGLENYLRYESYTDVENVYQSELAKKPEMIVNYQKKNYYDGEWKQEYARHAAFLQGWINGPDWPALARVNALTYDMIFTQPVIEEFQYLQVPTTLILGTRDRTAPGRANKKEGVTRELGRYDKLGKEVKARNNDIQLVELNGLGHLPHIENFERFKGPFVDALTD
jgi:pimeloyl-ACP methyl ester carboxylesterase